MPTNPLKTLRETAADGGQPARWASGYSLKRYPTPFTVSMYSLPIFSRILRT